jgi:hypothetical protein
MKLKSVLIILASVILLSVPFGVISYYNLNILEIHRIPTHVTVSKKKIGFNINNSKIYFGRVPQGSMGKRDVFIPNPYNIPVKISISNKGQTRDWISVSDNNFVLYPCTSINVTFYIRIPKDQDIGNYTGTEVIMYKKF